MLNTAQRFFYSVKGMGTRVSVDFVREEDRKINGDKQVLQRMTTPGISIPIAA